MPHENCGANSLKTCPLFRKKSVIDRRSVVEKLRLCFCCLFKGHSSANCKYRKKCKYCSSMHSDLLCPSVRSQDAFMLGDDTDSTDYEQMVEVDNDFDQVDEGEQPDDVVDFQEYETPDTFDENDSNYEQEIEHDDIPYQLDEVDNFFLEEAEENNYDYFLEQSRLFLPIVEDTVSLYVDGDVDSIFLFDFHSHVDALVDEMEETFWSDDESISDFDPLPDAEDDAIIDSIDLFQISCCNLDIQVDRVNLTQDLDPSFQYDFNGQHVFLAQPQRRKQLRNLKIRQI